MENAKSSQGSEEITKAIVENVKTRGARSGYGDIARKEVSHYHIMKS